MTANDDDKEQAHTLRRLLDDAVADVRPHDRLGEIRRRTRRTTRSSRRWLPVVAGAGVATAAVVGGAVVLGQLGGGEEPTAPLARPAPEPETRATAVYFVDQTPGGLRLFREFQSLPVADAPGTITHALARVDPAGGSVDPDYDTLWPEDSFADVALTDDRVVVTLGTEKAAERPAGVTDEEALVGVQQVVYTAQASLGEPLPVSFEYDGAPTSVVLGADVGTLVQRDRTFDVLSPVNISDPAEGVEIEDEVLVLRGTTTGLVDGVRWRITPAPGVPEGVDGDEAGSVSGGRVLVQPLDGSTVDQGLEMWESRVAVSDLAPGRYRLTASATDTGDGTGYRDTRTFVIP